MGFGLSPIWSGRILRGRAWSILFGFGRIYSEWLGWVSGCALSGRGGFCVVRFGRFCSGLVGFGRGSLLSRHSRPRAGTAPRRLRRFAVRQVVRFGRVCSDLFGGLGWVSGYALSGRGGFCVVGFGRFCTGLFRPGRASSLSRHSRPPSGNLPRVASDASLSGRWSGLVGSVRFWSGCSGCVPGCALSGRGGFCVVGFGRFCSDLFRFVRAWSGCAVAVR